MIQYKEGREDIPNKAHNNILGKLVSERLFAWLLVDGKHWHKESKKVMLTHLKASVPVLYS